MHPQPLALMEGLSGLLQEAALASQLEVRDNAREVENVLRKHQEKKLKDSELLAEIDGRLSTMRQLLKARRVKPDGRMARLTLGLLEGVRERITAKISSGGSEA